MDETVYLQRMSEILDCKNIVIISANYPVSRLQKTRGAKGLFGSDFKRY